MSVIVKICGITNLPDALEAVEAGADVIGFVFCESSRRCVGVEQASAIIQQLPQHVVKAGVFVDAPTDNVTEAARKCGLNLLQFHGSETPEYCLGFGLMSMKAFRVKGPESLEELRNYPTDAWLLDTYTPGKQGGTGERFDWAIAAAARQMGRPIFLAGGLTPENVAEAIRQAQPYGVDVSSGVEASPGKKDQARLRAFIRAAKQS